MPQDTPAAPEVALAPAPPRPEIASLPPGGQEPVSPTPTPQEPATSRKEPPSRGGVPGKSKRAPKSVLKGTLEIRVRPFATVFLNGKELGDTPMSPIELPPGIYTVKLVNKRIPKTVTRSVEVKPGQPNTLGVNLFTE
jgi:eukaryotic-like serine/threonine-protein kinase